MMILDSTMFLLLVHASLSECFLFCHRGKRFVLSFPKVGVNDNSSVLLSITGSRNTIISLNYYNDVTNYTIGDSGALNLVLNSSVRYNLNGVVSGKGVEIAANSPVSLHVISNGPASTSGFMALPTDKLSEKYFLVSADLQENDVINRWTIVAPQDDTNVIISLKGNNSSSCNTSMTFTLKMYDVVGGTCGHDITGSDIISDKPVAVIYSTQCTSTSTCYHVEEMLPPVMHYGNHYVLHEFSTNEQNITYKVVASEDNTDLTFTSSENLTMVEKGDFSVYKVKDNGQTCLMSNKPILVVAFAQGNKTRMHNTLMVVMQPVERFLNKYTVNINSTLISASFDLYVTLTFHEDHLNQLPPEFSDMNSAISCCKYRSATVLLSKSDFSLHLAFPFGAVLHGFDNNDGLALTLGFQYGARDCPEMMHYSSETRTCVKDHLSPGQLSWVEARDYCGQLGQQLPKLDTEDNNLFVRDVLADTFNSFFIGANDINGDGVLTWQDGDVVNFTYWYPNINTNSSLVDQCVILSRKDNHTWAPRTCTVKRRVLCQLELVYHVKSEDFIHCQELESSTVSYVMDSTTSLLSSVDSVNVTSSVSHLESEAAQTINPSSSSHVTGSQTLETSDADLSLGHQSTTIEGATLVLSSMTDSHLDLGSLESLYLSTNIHATGSEPIGTSGIVTETYTRDLQPSESDPFEQVSTPPTSVIHLYSGEDNFSEFDTLLMTSQSQLTSGMRLSSGQDVFSSIIPAFHSVSSDPTSAPTSSYVDNSLNTNLCPCDCRLFSGNKKLTHSELANVVQKIRNHLKVEKNNLTNRKARRISRSDRRQSAVTIGYTGITCLVLVFVFVVFLDVISLVQRIFTRYSRLIIKQCLE